jgi:hypothetical protein
VAVFFLLLAIASARVIGEQKDSKAIMKVVKNQADGASRWFDVPRLCALVATQFSISFMSSLLLLRLSMDVGCPNSLVSYMLSWLKVNALP